MGTYMGGSILFGYCLDIFLYGILTVQTYLYYLAFPQDRRITKSIVYFVYIIGTLQTAFALHDFYSLFTARSNNGHKRVVPAIEINRFGFMWFTIPASGALVGFVVQLFYAHRIYVISRTRVVTAIVSVLAFLQLVCGIIVAVCGFGPPRFESDVTTAISLPTGAAGGAVCDVLIAVYMSQYLSRQMKGASKTTQVLVTKVIRLMLETGILTAGAAVAYAALLFLPPLGYRAPGLSLGKLYANSMLVLLNNRFTIPGGRNVPHQDFDIPSYHRSGLVEASTGPIVSHSIFAHSRPAEVTLSGGEVCTTRLSPQQEMSASGTEGG